MLAKAPAELSLTFDEPVSPLLLKLVAPDGENVALGKRSLDGNRLTLGAPPDLKTGSYILSWRVISEDGHPVGGAIVFSIGMPSAGAAAHAAEPVDWPLRAAIWLCRALFYAGLFTGVGGVFFLSWVAPGASRRRGIVLGAIAAGLAGALLSLGLLGADALDLPVASMLQARSWATALATTYAFTVFIGAAAMLLAFGALSSPAARAAKAGSALAMAGVGLALASSGHAATADPQWLMRPAVFIHAVAVAFWVGALLPLAALFAGRDGGAGRALRRFSALIPYPLVALVVAGITLAVVQVRTPAALITTAYGRVLLVKLALVAILLVLAALNRWKLTKPVLAGEARAARRFTRSAAAEIVLVAAILGCVALWRFTPPPRALLAEPPAPPVSVHLHSDRAMASLTLSPGRAGPVDASIDLLDGNLEPLAAQEVTLAFAMPSAGIEPIRRSATKIGDGEWRMEGLRLPVAGKWDVTIDVLVSDFESVSLKSSLSLR